MHCTVDSTVGPKLPIEENSGDGSDAESQHSESLDVLNTTSEELQNNGDDFDAESQHSESLDVLNTTSEVDDLQNCTTESGATHLDSSPGPSGDASPMFSPASTSQEEEVEHILPDDVPSPNQDLRSNSPTDVPRPKPGPKSKSLFWCVDCARFYNKECTRHKIQLIFDKPILSRAWASLPAQYLAVRKVAYDELRDPSSRIVYGVIAKKTIPKRVRFGPVEGIPVKSDKPPDKDLVLRLENIDGLSYYLDTSDEALSNWMRFVRPAESFKEQNMVLVQQGESLYYSTTKSVTPRTELKVGYSTQYAQKWGLRELQPDKEEHKKNQKSAWACFECNQNFSSSEELQKHLHQHDNENDVPDTAITPRKTARLGKKRSRLIEEGDEVAVKKIKESPENKKKLQSKDEYKCDICQKSFPRSVRLEKHLKIHAREKKIKCLTCDMRFKDVSSRNKHVLLRHNSSTTNLKAKTPIKKKQGDECKCPHCGIKFENSNDLDIHTLTHSAEDVVEDEVYPIPEIIDVEDVDDDDSNMDCEEIIYKCLKCTLSFSSRKHLTQHSKVHSSGGDPSKGHKCDMCYKYFATQERLVKHYRVHSINTHKPVECDICPKKFVNNAALACHVKIHSHGGSVHECLICKEKFSPLTALREHVQVHCKKGVYTCPSCEKTFEEYNQLRSHVRQFHPERRYACDECDKFFPRSDKLKLHMLSHSDLREFLCNDCGKEFKRKDKLKEHMKKKHGPDGVLKVINRNTGEKRSIEKGDKTSSTPNKPKVPRTRDSGQQEFLCDNCGKQFSRAHSLKAHIKRIHAPGRVFKIRNPLAKKFTPKVPASDYQRFVYKCHTCLLGFRRRGMLVNHLAIKHPDIKPESVPELNLPILKTTRDYNCQHCDKIYRSNGKLRVHIMRIHPGSELPSGRRKPIGSAPEVLTKPNPNFLQKVCIIPVHPHSCDWCHRQYASRAKLLQHQRQKHTEMAAIIFDAKRRTTEISKSPKTNSTLATKGNNESPHPCDWCSKRYVSKHKLLQHQRKKHMELLAVRQAANASKAEAAQSLKSTAPPSKPTAPSSKPTAPSSKLTALSSEPIVPSSEPTDLSSEHTAVLINIDKDSIVVTTNAAEFPSADLLTQAMSVINQNFQAPSPIAPSDSANSESTTATIVESTQLDQLQLNQLIQQYIQQQNLNLT